MLDEVKRKQVYEILIMPICCQSCAKIHREKDRIISGQKYWPYKKHSQLLDEDMSDFAVGFYSVIYSTLLGEKSILSNEDGFVDKEFAGDTMNSYKTVAQRASSEETTVYLEEYEKHYHCLANFWLIPMHLGRTSKYTPPELKKWSKTSSCEEIQDYMDRFLSLYKSNTVKYKEICGNYFSKINGFEDFAKKHFLVGSYVSKDMEINNFSDDANYRKEVIEAIKDKIRLRAATISKSEYAEILWNYFNENGLVL